MKNQPGDFRRAMRRHGEARLDLVLVSIFLLCLIGGAIVFWTFSSPADDRPTSEVKATAEFRIDPMTASKIKLGMTASEVVGVIGKPAGDYASRPVYVPTWYCLHDRWISDTHVIVVRFFDGKVVDYRCFSVFRNEGFHYP